MQKLNALGNIKYDKKGDYAIFSINPDVYPLELIYSAAYVCIDKMYIILDGDPKREINVEIRKKDKKQDVKLLVMDFNNELLNYAVYKQQSEKNRGIKETILQKILLMNSPEYFDILSKQKQIDDKDVDGIMKTWEESNPKEAGKLGKKKNVKNAKNTKR